MDKSERWKTKILIRRNAVFAVFGFFGDMALYLLISNLGADFWLSVLLAALAYCCAIAAVLVKDQTERNCPRLGCILGTVVTSIVGIECSYMWFLAKVLLVSAILSKLLSSLFTGLYVSSVLSHFARSREPRMRKYEWPIYYCASGVVAGTIIFHYYAGNSSFYSIVHCILLVTALFFASTQLYFTLSVLLNPRNAVIPVCIIWIAFWSCFSIVSMCPLLLFLALSFVLIGCLSYVLYCHPVDHMVVLVLGGVICTLFLFNLSAAFITAVNKLKSGDGQCETKTHFDLDATVAHPDIYWFHMDGMMGFDTVSDILDDNQVDFQENLEGRGFVINRDAALDVGWTSLAIPSITSPTVYDTYIEGLLEPLKDNTSKERRKILEQKDEINYTLANQELFTAFRQAGYESYYVLFDIGHGLEPIPTDYQHANSDEGRLLGNIISLLSEYSLLHAFSGPMNETILKHIGLSSLESKVLDESFSYVNESSWFQYSSIRHYDRCLAAIFEELLTKDTPKIVYIQDMMTHYPFIYDENGIYQFINESHRMEQYLPQQKYATSVLLGMVDRIIEEDQDAIIIIQGDHGVHAFNRSELAKQGFSDAQMIEMNFSTISAVMIPEKYGSLTEPLDPLDITRYLVNHYVGKGNYHYRYYREEE